MTLQPQCLPPQHIQCLSSHVKILKQQQRKLCFDIVSTVVHRPPLRFCFHNTSRCIPARQQPLENTNWFGSALNPLVFQHLVGRLSGSKPNIPGVVHGQKNASKLLRGLLVPADMLLFIDEVSRDAVKMSMTELLDETTFNVKLVRKESDGPLQYCIQRKEEGRGSIRKSQQGHCICIVFWMDLHKRIPKIFFEVEHAFVFCSVPQVFYIFMEA